MIFVMQPFYRTLVDSGAAFVWVEEERDELRAALEQSKRARLPLVISVLLFCVAPIDICFVFMQANTRRLPSG